jgi:hypothetical protein
MSSDTPSVPVRAPHDFVALSPAEMTTAHEGMLRWAESKVREMSAEIGEFQAEAKLAKENGWRSGGFERHKKIAQRRLAFYQKIIDALKAGYIVVPNFAMTAFAIRTTAESPRGGKEIYTWSTPTFEQQAEVLPSGEGRYVNPEPSKETWTEDGGLDKEGKPKELKIASPDDFVDVVFPLAVAKVQIMAATAQAMALKVFDEIGMTDEWHGGRRGDPIVLGRLLNPRRNAPSVTFFIGWYFDARRI